MDVLLGVAWGWWEHPANHQGIQATVTLITAVAFSEERLYLVNPGVYSLMLSLGGGRGGKNRKRKIGK